MFKSGVASIGIFSLVGNSLISASTEVISPTTNEEKVANLLLDIQNGEVPLNEDVIYMKLLGIFPSGRVPSYKEFKSGLEQAAYNASSFKFDSADNVLLNLVEVVEKDAKQLAKGEGGKLKNCVEFAYKKFLASRARGLVNVKEYVQKINSLRKFVALCVKGPISAVLSGQWVDVGKFVSLLTAELTKDEAHSVLDFFDNLKSSDDSIDDNKLCGIVAYTTAVSDIYNTNKSLLEKVRKNIYADLEEFPKILDRLKDIGVDFVPIIRKCLKSGEFSNYPLPVYPIESLRQLNTLKAAREREKLIDKKQDIWKQNVTEDKGEESKSKNKEKQSYENFLIGGTVAAVAICAIVAGVNYIKRWFSGKNEEVKHEAKSFPQQKLSDREAF